ncbi:MAG: DUF2723 domain-containing protein [Candidatus Eiseniibacteriota bacterium]|nr:MAG: DUF2723 domain-containing protein [Candidatus Eisenbacteria bacterium]
MRKAEALIALCLFALFVLAYAHTCSLSVSWQNFSEDSGDLLAAAYTLGIPHPTGYPLYVLLGRVLALAMPGSIAFRITLLSLLCTSAAAVFVFLTLARLLPGRGGLLGATLAALSLGFSVHVWSQAVVAEVYALHLFLMSVAVYCLVRWTHTEVPPGEIERARLDPPKETPRARPGPAGLEPKPQTATAGRVERGESGGLPLRSSTYLLAAAYVVGLSFANHMLSVVTVVFALLYVLSGPWRGRLDVRTCLWALFLFALPLTLYAYLPLRSMRDPHLDWGNPETWDQLRWVVTGAQYRFRLLGKPLAETVSRLWPGPFLTTGWLVALLALAGLLGGRMTGALRIALVGTILTDLAAVVFYDIPDFLGYLLPAILALSLLAGAGFHRVVETCGVLLERTGRATLARHGVSLVAGLLVVAAIAPSARENRKVTDASADLHPYVFGRATFTIVEPNALIVSEYDGRTFALWFFLETEYKDTHPDCIVVLKYLLVWPWYVDNLRELHPDLSVPEAGHMDTAMLRLVAANIDTRPVYTVRDDPALIPFFEFKPVFGGLTPLFKVERAGGARTPND